MCRGSGRKATVATLPVSSPTLRKASVLNSSARSLSFCSSAVSFGSCASPDSLATSLARTCKASSGTSLRWMLLGSWRSPTDVISHHSRVGEGA